jgi:hypothetical protein
MNVIVQIGVWIAVIAIGSCLFYLYDKYRLRRLAARRSEESICTFVRALDYRHMDTKVIRAVYEELQRYFAYAHPSLPLRPTDRFHEEFDFDTQDLEEVVSAAAKRCGRDMRDAETNPHFGRVVTVADLIEFLCAQPRHDAA